MKTNDQLLADALAKLVLEAIHYRNTGKGKQFLNMAIENAEGALIYVRKDNGLLPEVRLTAVDGDSPC